MNFDDICSYDPSDHSLCPSQLRSFENNIHRPSHGLILEKMKEAYTNKVKQTSRHIYFGTKDGFFVAYPADNSIDNKDDEIPIETKKCQCAAYDPRFRYVFAACSNPSLSRILYNLFQQQLCTLYIN